MIEYAKTYIKGLPTSVTWDNLSLHGKEKLAEWIDGSMILISNDYEFEMITKKTGKAKELLKLTKPLSRPLRKGSLVSNSEFDIQIPSKWTTF